MPVRRGELDHSRCVVRVPLKIRLRVLLNFRKVVDRKALGLLHDLQIIQVHITLWITCLGHLSWLPVHLPHQAQALATRERALEELEAVDVVLGLLDLLELGQVLAYVVAHAELAFCGHDFVKLLVLELLLAERVVALHLAALLLVGIYL